MYTTLALSDSQPSSLAFGRACDGCRRLKIRCRYSRKHTDHGPQVRGPCDECRRSGSRCRNDEKRRKRGRPSKQYGKGSFACCLHCLNGEHREQHPTHLPYDETVIDFQLSPSTKPKGNSSSLPLVRPDALNIASFDVVPDVLHGDIIPEIPSNRDDLIHSTAYAQPATDAESAVGRQRSHGHSPNNYTVMPLPEAGPAGSEDVAVLESHILAETLEDLAEYVSPTYEPPAITSARPESLNEQSSEQEIWSSIQYFFDTMHVIFPVLSYADLLSRVILQPDWTTKPDLRTLLLAVRMINAAGDYRMTVKNDIALKELIRHVETSRLTYDFAELPTLDEVIISLFLFTSYNVLEKHNRAFLYLDEALSLMESVQTVGGEEECRRTQIEQVLYNTEAASLAIYAGQSKQRRARKPRLLFNHPPTGLCRIETGEESENVALHLLERLTEIHVAEDTEALRIINTASEADMNSLFGAAFGMHRYCRIQAADVAVTRQWQLSSKLVTSARRQTNSERLGQSSIENLGTAALAWVCLLKEGEPRIVGLGKLAGLAQNIRTLSVGKSTSYSVAGLVSAVIREDHERKFAPQLADIISPMVLTTPRSLYPFGDTPNEDRFQTSFCLSQGSRVASPPIIAYEQSDDEGVDDLSWYLNLS